MGISPKKQSPSGYSLVLLGLLLIAVLVCQVFSSCTSRLEDSREATPEFQAFLQARQGLPSANHSEQAEGFTYNLEHGVLSVFDSQGNACWRSENTWWVEDFRLIDVDADGSLDFVFSLWKSWSYYGDPPYGQTDSPEVRCHLFVYSMRSIDGRFDAIALWGSSNLPYPILSFELDTGGEQTPVASGVLLHTIEGSYAEAPLYLQREPGTNRSYAWQGWGFVELD